MTVLSDKTIRRLCTVGAPLYIPGSFVTAPMIEPFCERTVFEGKTFGLSCAGYDIRVAEGVWLGEGNCSSFPNFSLASSIEKFRMPLNVLGRVCDKSTWARLGLAVQNTVLEPGWEGYLTLELSNNKGSRIKIKEGSPIAQIIFEYLDSPSERAYSGKYQNQPAGPQPAILEK